MGAVIMKYMEGVRRLLAALAGMEGRLLRARLTLEPVAHQTIIGTQEGHHPTGKSILIYQK